MADMMLPKILIRRSRVALRGRGSAQRVCSVKVALFATAQQFDPNCVLYGVASAFELRLQHRFEIALAGRAARFVGNAPVSIDHEGRRTPIDGGVAFPPAPPAPRMRLERSAR